MNSNISEIDFSFCMGLCVLVLGWSSWWLLEIAGYLEPVRCPTRRGVSQVSGVLPCMLPWCSAPCAFSVAMAFAPAKPQIDFQI